MLVGVLISVVAVGLGFALENGNPYALFQFSAFLIVFGGSLGAVIVSYSWSAVVSALNYWLYTLKKDLAQEAVQREKQLKQIARIFRIDQTGGLDSVLKTLKDPFVKQVINHMAETLPTDELEATHRFELELRQARRLKAAEVWQAAGGYAPTLGILGAVLGLIHVMANLTNTSELGQGIAVAFVATIYGVGSANLLFIPIASRLRLFADREALLDEMVVNFAKQVLSNVNPSLIDYELEQISQSISRKNYGLI